MSGSVPRLNYSIYMQSLRVVILGGNPTVTAVWASVLTWLFSTLWMGNQTIIVATLGPASYSYKESLSTLCFANQSKNFKIKP